jgi:hypothetical protein
MNDDRSTEFSYADEDPLLDQLLARADDSVLVSLETALEREAGLADIFQLHPSHARRRRSDARQRVTKGKRPPQDAITDQQHGSQRP